MGLLLYSKECLLLVYVRPILFIFPLVWIWNLSLCSYYPPSLCRDTAPLSPVEQVRRRIKLRRRSWTDPRTVLVFFALLSCVATLVFVYLRAAQSLP